MIPVITFGSQEGAIDSVAVAEENAHGDGAENDEAGVEGGKDGKTKRNAKGSIPKLEKEDRLEVLPFIIKLLISKLLKKRGSINKKSINVRRNIVYQFLSGLDPKTEFPLFFKELLEPLGLRNLISHDNTVTMSTDELKSRLSKVSFSVCISYISSLEVIFKQLGTLLSCNDFLSKLSTTLVLILSQAKHFLGHLKEEQEEKEERENDAEPKAADGQEGALYRYVGRQCKIAVRKGLKIIKQLYSKFGHLQQY